MDADVLRDQDHKTSRVSQGRRPNAMGRPWNHAGASYEIYVPLLGFIIYVQNLGQRHEFAFTFMIFKMDGRQAVMEI